MDISAVAQVTQNQSTVAPQDGDDSVSMLFSYLLKHQLGTGQTGGGLLDSNPMINMVGNGTAYVPPPPPAPPSAPSANSNNTQTQSNQNANGGPASANAGSSQQASSVDPNAGGNGGTNAQTGSGDQNSQQTSSNSGSTNSGSQTAAGPAGAPVAQAPASNGEDAVTEATAAAAAIAIHLVQQTQPVAAAAAGPVREATTAVDPKSGPTTPSTGPSNAQAATSAAPVASAARAAAAVADEGDEPASEHWSLNFLNTVSAANPQIAQQASNLSQITNGTSATVTTQTTSGGTVASPSASALVPDAVLAISGFLQDGGQDASTGGGTGGQTNDQPAANAAADPTATDPDALMLAQDAQALFALTSAIQTVAQDLAANAAQPQTGPANVAAASAPAAPNALETPLPQNAAPTTQANGQTGFAAQLQDSEQTQAPQAKTQIASPNAVDQIKMQIEKGLAQGSSTIKVQLTPENMGRVEVKLQVQDGSVKATITADRADTLAVLKSDQQGLVQSLQDAGLNADSNSLSFFLRGEQQQRQFAQGQRQGRGQSGGGADEDPLLAVSAASGAAQSAGAGNLDISV
jgi:flagellar hook-length control protein FliK